MTRPELSISSEHLRALARRSFPFFCRGAFQVLHPSIPILWNWHLDLIASKLQDVLDGKCRRLIINIPPRYGKSLIASVAFPAFVLGHNPHAELICASYAYDLAEKMARDTRRLMETEFYQSIFGTPLASGRERLSEIKTREGGYRLSTSVEGTLTGRGGNFIIIDDPLKPTDSRSDNKRQAVNDWFDGTVVTRPNNKETDAIVIIMQRLHEDDLVGHLMAQGTWDVISLPAVAEEGETWTINNGLVSRTYTRREGELLHPARESAEEVARMRATMSSYDFAAQYQQRPAPAGGGEIREEWFPRYDPQNAPVFIRKVQSWDTACKLGTSNDYSACVTLGETANKHYYVLDCYRERLLFPDLKRKVRQLAELHEVDTVLIEDTVSGTSLIQELRHEGFHNLYGITPKGTKYERTIAQTALIEANRVWLPQLAHWVPIFLHEAAMFPNGKFDDQIDALAQGLQWMTDCSGAAHFLWAMEEADRMRREQAAGCVSRI